MFEQKRRKVALRFQYIKQHRMTGAQGRTLAAVVINYARQMTFTESWGVIDDESVTQCHEVREPPKEK
jgi:hypothetical protein